MLEPVGYKPVIKNGIKPSHLELFQTLAQVTPTPVDSIRGGLLVLATPRCGSTMFCEALNSSGELGLCEEWYNYEYFAAYLAATGKELFHLTEYTEWVSSRSSHNGTFCLKWHVGQIQDMQRDFAFEIKNMNFDLVVWIYRRNPLAQSVSLARALKSNKFRSYEEGEEQDVDCVDITSALAILTSQHRYIEQELLGVINYSFAYEDVCDLTHPAYEQVHTAFGKRITSPLATRVQIQRDEKSEEVLLQYKTYLNTLLEHA